MPIATDMKNMAEGIEVSYGERAAFLSDLSKETNETLKTFHREHGKMAGDLWDFLSSDRDDREKVVAALCGKNKKELRVMAEGLKDFLKESNAAVKKDTAKLMARIREDISSMGKDMREERVSATRERIKQVKKMLATFSAEQEGRSRELHHQLSSFQKELESTVKEMRAPVIRDLMETRQNWQNLARIMAAKRAGKAVTAVKKIEGVAKKEVVEAVAAFTAGNLKEQVSRLVSEADSGITLTQMGKALGIPYVRLAKPASELVNEGKIKKEDSEYFKSS